MSEASEAEAFTALTERLEEVAPGFTVRLSPLGAGILAALHLGIARDSRSFSRIFGIEHALVLREIVMLCEDRALLQELRRDERTQRLWPELTAASRALLAAAG